MRRKSLLFVLMFTGAAGLSAQQPRPSLAIQPGVSDGPLKISATVERPVTPVVVVTAPAESVDEAAMQKVLEASKPNNFYATLGELYYDWALEGRSLEDRQRYPVVGTRRTIWHSEKGFWPQDFHD